MHITDVLVDAMRGAALDDDQQWQRIIAALDSLATRLLAWGEFLAQSDAPPELSTIEEIATELSALVSTLRELDVWLDQHQQPRWLGLQAGVRSTLQLYYHSNIRESLSVYLRCRAEELLKRRNQGGQTLRCERERLHAGDGLTEFGIALRRALLDASMMR